MLVEEIPIDNLLGETDRVDVPLSKVNITLDETLIDDDRA